MSEHKMMMRGIQEYIGAVKDELIGMKVVEDKVDGIVVELKMRTHIARVLIKENGIEVV